MFSSFIQRAVEIGIGVYRTQINITEVEAAFRYYGSTALNVAFRLLQALVIFIALLTSSCIIFGMLHMFLMPRRLHEREAFLDFETPRPSAQIDLLSEHTQWHPTNLVKTTTVSDRLLKAGQKYTVFVDFTLPRSEVNKDLGVFMVDLTLQTHQNKILAHSRRPALLLYQSKMVETLSQLITFPLIFLGVLREEEHIQVFCFDNFEESLEHPLAAANLSISSVRAQVYHTSLAVTAQLTGLPYLLQHHFWLTAACCVAFIMCLEVGAGAILFLWFKLVLLDDEEERQDERGELGAGAASLPGAGRGAAAAGRGGGGGGGGGGPRGAAAAAPREGRPADGWATARPAGGPGGGAHGAASAGGGDRQVPQVPGEQEGGGGGGGGSGGEGEEGSSAGRRRRPPRRRESEGSAAEGLQPSSSLPQPGLGAARGTQSFRAPRESDQTLRQRKTVSSSQQKQQQASFSSAAVITGADDEQW